MNPNNFKNQLEFISTTIGALNHPERLQVGGAYDSGMPWKSDSSIRDFQKYVKSFQQHGPYYLLMEFSTIVKNLNKTESKPFPISAIIFISNTSNAALLGAHFLSSNLTNVQITFVLLGNNADENNLKNYSTNFIYWKDLSKSQPDGWNDDVAAAAYKCKLSTTVNSPPMLTSTSPSTSLSTTSRPDYYPCKSNIVFVLDSSSDNGDMEFKQVQNLLINNIVTANWTHFERIGLMSYADHSSSIYEYGSFSAKHDFDTIVKSYVTKFSNKNSITFGIGTLMKTFIDVPLNFQNTVFFTSTSDPADVARASTNSHIIDQRGALIIVAIYPASKQDLLPLVDDPSKIIEFNPLSNIDYDTYAREILKHFYCGSSTATPATAPTFSSTTPTPSAPTSSTPYVVTAKTSTPSVPTSSTPAPYYPCQSWISFSYDDSSTLKYNDFKTQMNFIASVIGVLNYPERVQVVGMYNQLVTWNSGLTIQEIQNAVISQLSHAELYSLRSQFASLITNLQNIQINNIPIGAIIFISDTSDRALANAYRFMPQLSSVQLTFVLLGKNVDASKLTQFSSNFITWSDLSNPQPSGWNDIVAAAAYGLPQTIPSSTPSMSPTGPTTTLVPASSMGSTSTGTGTTVTTPEPFILCQSWISFSYDDSSTLQNNDYKTQMNFISTVIETINYPNRLRIAGAFTDAAYWNSHQTIGQMQTELGYIEQTSNAYKLLQQFANLVTDLQNTNTTTSPVGALIFISDTSDRALANAARFMPQLSSVQLTFVLLGTNVDATKLTIFSSNFIYWSDLSQPQPDNWNNVFYNAYGCNGVITRQPPSTVSTLATAASSTVQSSTVPSTTTTSSAAASSTTSNIATTVQSTTKATTSATTSMNQPSSTAPSSSPLIPYLPCQHWISFSYDDSVFLNNIDFKAQMSFISSTIGNIHYPDQLRVVGAFTYVAFWKSNQKIAQMQAELNSLEQTAISYSLSQPFGNLLVDAERIGDIKHWSISALIFISDTSDLALADANISFNQLPSTVKITFVLLGSNVDSKKLLPYSNNFIYWPDLSQPQPDNWDIVSLKAFGCPTTMTYPPSVSPTRAEITTYKTQTVTVQTSHSTTPSTPYIVTNTRGGITIHTIQTIEPYLPCQSWISFSFDDSNVMEYADFMTQVNFISRIIGSINYPERIAVSGMYYDPVTWNSGLTIPQIQTFVTYMHQSGPYSLRSQFGALTNNLQNIQINNSPVGSVIFISDTSDAALDGAEALFYQLQNVRITFVLLGSNVDATKLTKYSSNFIYWSDLSQPQPDNWDNLFYHAYGCNGIITQQTTSTFSSVVPSAATSSSTFVPYIPCPSWISFSYDDSSSLNNVDFKTQLSFISSAINQINYPDRLRVNGVFTEVATFNSHQTIAQMQRELAAFTNTTANQYSLLQEFARLFTDVETIANGTTWPIGSLIFISNTSDPALANADHFFNLLPPSVKITFVLLGNNVDSTKLARFSNNFIYWSNLSQPQPDNWDNKYYNVYGCTHTPLTTPFLPTRSTTKLSSTVTTALPYVYPRVADIVFILDDSNCDDLNSNINSQTDTIWKVLSNSTLSDYGVRVANPRSICSLGYNSRFSTNLLAFHSNLLDCHYGYDSNFTIEKALRSSMSFAYQFSRNISESLIFVVFTLNNGTALQIGDDGSAINAAIKYRNKCMKPGNVEIIQINPSVANVSPTLGDYFFMHDDPNLFEKFANAIMAAKIYGKSGIFEYDCIDTIVP
uniref:VWFA domain-containing protein n=1 Tax=Panagrolaimus sp. ES5 TaxID=591445 RepID=A0AC34GUM5_9BILA